MPNSPGLRSASEPRAHVLADVGDRVLARRIDAAHDRAAVGVAGGQHRLPEDVRRGGLDVRLVQAAARDRRQSARSGTPRISMCDATARMRLRSSCWNPFITDSTTISAATPSTMPAIEMSEMKEMNVLRPEPLRARV